MELKTIIAIALVAFIIGGFIFFAGTKQKEEITDWGRREKLRPFSIFGGQNENAENR